MRTILDEAKTLFLETLVYGGDVRAVVVEGFRDDRSEDIKIGEHVIKEAYAIEPCAESRRFVVRFPRPIACQVVDESCTALDNTEVRDNFGFLQILSRSTYLSYVEAHHGWFIETVGPAKHYRLWTENSVLDVVAHNGPVVELWNGA